MGSTSTQVVSEFPYTADYHSLSRNTGRQIDWASVATSRKAGSWEVTCNGGAAADATTLPVLALAYALQAGTILYFGEEKEFAMLTANEPAGETSLAVEALPSIIEDEDTAWVDGEGAKTILAGTIMAELASGKVIPREDVSGAETAISLLETNAVEGAEGDALTGFGQIIGGVIYQNMLPDAEHASIATWIGELEVAGVGLGWGWETYVDDRAD